MCHFLIWNVDGDLIWDNNYAKCNLSTPTSISFNYDSTKIASGNHGDSIYIWDIPTKRLVKNLYGYHTQTICKVLFNTNFLISASHDNTIIFWNPDSTYQKLFSFKGDTPFDAISLNEDCTLLASGSRDNLIRIWDLRMRRELITLEKQIYNIDFVCFNGQTLASGIYDGTIKIWDTTDWKEKLRLKDNNIGSMIGLEYKKNTLISACRHSITVWNNNRHYTIHEPHLHSDGTFFGIHNICLDNTGTLLASVSYNDGFIRLWG